ncbi:pectin lyase fold/virulence factor [Mucidula mucida]|nr:pectin lyase fold/virulence factor [Mucidula mucida]
MLSINAALFVGLLSSSAAQAATLYVSPTGTSSGTGTLTSPFGSIQSAVNAATAGSTIYLREGRSPYVVSAYESEKVVIDGEALTGTPAETGGSLANKDRGIFHIEDANFWEFYGIELRTGRFQLEGASANNTVLYLDSYMNRDPRKNGESADGFACKEGSGAGNVLKGARLWNNVDDGLDLWEFKSAITIQDTISWGNGYNRWGFSPFEGDGNGFKLGGGDAGDIGSANHIVTNSIAFGNSADGFTDNSQPGSFTFTRNTAWNNAKDGFKSATASSTLKSNIAALNAAAQASLSGSYTSSGNSWDSSGTWGNSSFESVDTSWVTGARGSDGKIAASNFLLPTSGAAIGATTTWS